MAGTRSSTGNSKPRVIETVSTEPTRKRTTTKKPKSNTSAKRVTKPKTGGGVRKHKPTLKDKAEGAIEKVVGKVEGKPGKEGAGTKKMRGEGGAARTKRAVAV